MTRPDEERNRPPATANFDPVANWYRALEFVAFGGDLERARFCLLPRLADRRRILILGEGDGRCLARLVALAPAARIDCIDASPAMLAAAARRLPSAARERVTFRCADALAASFGDERYDAILTLFFLDCFRSDQVRSLVSTLGEHAAPEACWLFADFVVPPRGWRRWRAHVWLAVLYTFFRWGTGLRVSRLPDSEAAIASAGFTSTETQTRQHGLLRTTLYRRTGEKAENLKR